MMKNADKYRGCLIGGAVGDALGYAVEFLKDYQIFERYSERGITEYTLTDGIAQISDDTQMTLFTANGLLVGTTQGMVRGVMGTYPSYIYLCYEDWLLTQGEGRFAKEKQHCSWLNNIDEMNHTRDPGRTCIFSIMNGEAGTIDTPLNNSKGCGGIMRVAPIGLYFEGKDYTVEEIDMIGAETAALTHGHELGYIPAAALVHIIHLVSHNPDITLLQAVTDAKETMIRLFSNSRHLSELTQLIDKAVELSKEAVDDLAAIRALGEGWVAEETLAIAVYCALKYSDDFEKAITASVNHSGDSDSTGAVTGNILGAYLGLSAVPQKFLDKLELREVITEMADDLYNDCRMSEQELYRDEVWERKYIDYTYKK